MTHFLSNGFHNKNTIINMRVGNDVKNKVMETSVNIENQVQKQWNIYSYFLFILMRPDETTNINLTLLLLYNIFSYSLRLKS